MSWDKVEQTVEKGPLGAAKMLFLGVILLMVVGAGVSFFGGILGWFGEAQQVAREEFGPRAMLQKYEWFKNAAASLDAKKKNISVLQSRLAVFEKMGYTNLDRTDKENYQIWTQEVAGAKMSYNNLAADWNSQISKFNWKPFVGDLPAGAEQTLSTEYAPYETE